MRQGYISLHRKITENWIWDDPMYVKAWIAILLEVNHASRKVVLGSRVFTAERGESLKSCESWAAIFGQGWDRFKVRRFFKLLEQDGMIRTKNERKTLRVSVVNYKAYQEPRTKNAQKSHELRTNVHEPCSQTIMIKNENNEEEGRQPASTPPDFLRFFKGNGCYVPDDEHWFFEEAYKKLTSAFLKVCIKECKEQRRLKKWKPNPCMSDLQPCIEDNIKKYKNDIEGVYRSQSA